MFQINLRRVCVFSSIGMPEISEGEKLRIMWVLLMKKHQSLLRSTSARCYSQCVSIFEKYFELFSESNTEKQTVKTVTCRWQNRPLSPTSADWVIQSRNTRDFMIYIPNQLVLNKKFQMAKIIAMSTWPSPSLSLGEQIGPNDELFCKMSFFLWIKHKHKSSAKFVIHFIHCDSSFQLYI